MPQKTHTKAYSTKNKIIMKKIKRIPRPSTLTFQLKGIKKGNNQEEKKRVLRYIIKNNFTLNNKPINLTQIQQMIDLPMNTILKEFMKGNLFLMSEVESRQKASFSGENCKMAIFWALSDRQQIEAQSNLLFHAQKGKYVPFLSNSVNSSLSNNINSQKTLHSLLALMQNQEALELKKLELGSKAGNPTEGSKYLTTEEALRLLEDTTIPITQLPQYLPEPEGLNLIDARGENVYALPQRTKAPELDPTLNLDTNLSLEAEPKPIPKKPLPRPKHIDRNEANDAEIIEEEDLDDEDSIEVYF